MASRESILSSILVLNEGRRVGGGTSDRRTAFDGRTATCFKD